MISPRGTAKGLTYAAVRTAAGSSPKAATEVEHPLVYLTPTSVFPTFSPGCRVGDGAPDRNREGVCAWMWLL